LIVPKIRHPALLEQLYVKQSVTVFCNLQKTNEGGRLSIFLFDVSKSEPEIT